MSSKHSSPFAGKTKPSVVAEASPSPLPSPKKGKYDESAAIPVYEVPFENVSAHNYKPNGNICKHNPNALSLVSFKGVNDMVDSYIKGNKGKPLIDEKYSNRNFYGCCVFGDTKFMQWVDVIEHWKVAVPGKGPFFCEDCMRYMHMQVPEDARNPMGTVNRDCGSEYKLFCLEYNLPVCCQKSFCPWEFSFAAGHYATNALRLAQRMIVQNLLFELNVCDCGPELRARFQGTSYNTSNSWLIYCHAPVDACKFNLLPTAQRMVIFEKASLKMEKRPEKASALNTAIGAVVRDAAPGNFFAEMMKAP